MKPNVKPVHIHPFMHTFTHRRVVSHARRQAVRQEQSGGGVSLRDTSTLDQTINLPVTNQHALLPEPHAAISLCQHRESSPVARASAGRNVFSYRDRIVNEVQLNNNPHIDSLPIPLRCGGIVTLKGGEV